MSWVGNSTSRAVGVGVGLMLLGIISGVIGVNVTYHLAAFVGIAETGYGQWITRYGLQYGFLLLIGAYVYYRGSTDRFVRIERLDGEGVAWIVLGPVALVVLSIVFDPILGVIGIEMSTGEPAADPTVTLSQFAVFFAAAWLVAAPSEELLFRGLIQGRLRESMGPVGAVVLASSIFALMHVLIGMLEGRPGASIAGWGVETLAGGLVFGAAYERTENLVVPSVIHATMWTLPYFVPV